MIEHVYSFGAHGGLVGILTEPGAGVERHGAPTVVFSNIGLNHRVGPNRLYVELARRLADAGFRSLRFDLSGFGDSEPRRVGSSDLERATLDTREALDFLQQRGSSVFVLVGLCSGVDSAHAATLEDARVAGAIFIEGYAYRNAGFWMRFWTVRNLQIARWRRYLRVRTARFAGTLALPEVDEMPAVFARDQPSRAQFQEDITTLVKRSVRMLFVYTVNMDNSYNYPGQFHDTFGYERQIDVRFYPRADHVFSTEAYRNELLTDMVQWLSEKFPAEYRPATRGSGTPPAVLAGTTFTVAGLAELVANLGVIGT